MVTSVKNKISILKFFYLFFDASSNKLINLINLIPLYKHISNQGDLVIPGCVFVSKR